MLRCATHRAYVRAELLIQPTRPTQALIEFFISEAADAVLVKVRESGFAHLDAPDEIRQAGVKANTEGWQHELGELKLHSEEATAA